MAPETNEEETVCYFHLYSACAQFAATKHNTATTAKVFHRTDVQYDYHSRQTPGFPPAAKNASSTVVKAREDCGFS